MAETLTDTAQIKAAYKTRRARQWMSQGVLALLLAAFVIMENSIKPDHTAFGVPAVWLLAAALVVMVAVGVYMFRNWRCPACNRFFRGEFDVKQCPGCGAEMH